MSEIPINIRVRAGNDLLHIPFCLNVKNTDDQALGEILTAVVDSLGAKYFRDQSLFMEVLADKRAAANKPFTFLYGPYVSVTIRQNGELRVSLADEVSSGSTVYGHDQFFGFADAITPEDVAQALKSAMRTFTSDTDPSP